MSKNMTNKERNKERLALAKKALDAMPDGELIKRLNSTPACGPTAQEFAGQLKENIQTIIHASFHRFVRGLSVQAPSTLKKFIVQVPASPYLVLHGVISASTPEGEVQLLIVYDDGEYSVLAGTEEPKSIIKDESLTKALDATLLYLRNGQQGK